LNLRPLGYEPNFGDLPGLTCIYIYYILSITYKQIIFIDLLCNTVIFALKVGNRVGKRTLWVNHFGGCMKRFKTEYPGVFYRNADRIGGKGKEKVFYVVFKKNNKTHEEKAGRQHQDDMTAARAARIRASLIEGNRKSRPDIRAEKKTVSEIMTINKIWDKYKESHPQLKGIAQDESRFRLYIEPTLGYKQPSELVPLDIDRIRINLSKKSKPATVRNTLELIRRIINFAAKKQLCTVPSFKIEMPKVNNEKTEDLNEEQRKKLLDILHNGTFTDKDGVEFYFDVEARQAMLLALCTGMRKSEIFALKWEDVDFQRGFIYIRDPKGGKDQTIPLSDVACDLLKNQPHSKDSPYVFPGRKKNDHKKDAAKQFRAIRDAAGLPKDFRPMHGLRHSFASHLASSGKVDLYTIQRLLTHQSPLMTQRYAHLRDATLRKASNLAGSIILPKNWTGE